MSKSSERRIALQKRKRKNKRKTTEVEKHYVAQNNGLRAQLSLTRLISAAVLSKLSESGECVLSTSDLELVKGVPLLVEQTARDRVTVKLQLPEEEVPAVEVKTLEPDAA